MSTANTFQIPLNDSYVGIVGPSMKLEQCILELVSRLDDDIPLREFFVGNTFSDLFKEHRDFHTFVSSKQIFPAVYLQNSGHDTLDFFAGMPYLLTYLLILCGRERTKKHIIIIRYDNSSYN